MTKKSIQPRGKSQTRQRSRTASDTRASSSGRSRGKASIKNSKGQAEPETKNLPNILRVLIEDPDALRNLRHYLPSWADEALAIGLLGVGAVMFASLLSAGGEGELSADLAQLLHQGFGNGAFLVALGIIAAGILILLPKIGIRITFSWAKIIGLELVFVSFQGLLHATAFEQETQALARQGEGGGYVGWAINDLVLNLGGEPINVIILGVGLFIGLHLLLGIRGRHYAAAVANFSAQLRDVAQRIDPDVETQTTFDDEAYVEPVAQAVPSRQATQTQPVAAATPMQPRQERTTRRATPQKTGRTTAPPRPSVTAAANIAPTTARTTATTPSPSIENETAPSVAEPKAAPPPQPAQRSTPTPLQQEAPKPPPPTSEPETDDLAERHTLVVNGQVIDAAPLNKERPSIVPRDENPEKPNRATMQRPKSKRHRGGRDDDPNKRYFTVDDFKERRKVGKRHDDLPPIELLGDYDMHKPDEDEVNRNATIIENTLYEFDIDADVIDVKIGPVVTQYAVSPIKEILNPDTGQIEVHRVRVDKITNLQGDLSLALSAKTLRIEAPVPGHSYVGVEVPNRQSSTVGLRPVLESEVFYKERHRALAIPLGRDVSGESVVFDLASLPHLLVGGTTGSGKSVFLASVVASIVMNNTPDTVRLIMLDPKRVELPRFNGLPHLLGPVETEADRIVGVLRWTAREMDRRYKLMELENARNIDSYNDSLGRRRKQDHLPYIVVVFDEIGDLMMSHPDETESTITRLAQKARAAGIHLVIATQRPSTDVVTGLIKANFPGRIGFAVASGTDSRVILDYTGAETLLGRGDMLYLAPDAAGPKRIQGCFVADEEVEEITLYWKNWHEEQIAEGIMEKQRVAPWERGLTRIEAMSEQDPMLEDAIKQVCEAGEASTSMIQRRLGIGYPRAASLMDSLYELGIIGPPKSGGRTRDVRVNSYKQAMKLINRKGQ